MMIIIIIIISTFPLTTHPSLSLPLSIPLPPPGPPNSPTGHSPPLRLLAASHDSPLNCFPLDPQDNNWMERLFNRRSSSSSSSSSHIYFPFRCFAHRLLHIVSLPRPSIGTTSHSVHALSFCLLLIAFLAACHWHSTGLSLTHSHTCTCLLSVSGHWRTLLMWRTKYCRCLDPNSDIKTLARPLAFRRPELTNFWLNPPATSEPTRG